MHTEPLTSNEKALLRQAPDDWTDVPRFASVNVTMDTLEKKGLIERRSVPGIGAKKMQWKIVERRKGEAND